MMSLVLHRLNHDMPEYVPDFAAYCQETGQPKHKHFFVNEVQHSLLQAQVCEESDDILFAGKELTI
jgi:hypothetical protein